MKIVDQLQGILSFENCTSKHFRRNGMGKIGTTGFVLGAVGGIHFGVLCTLVVLSWGGIDLGSPVRVQAVVRERFYFVIQHLHDVKLLGLLITATMGCVYEPTMLLSLHGVFYHRREPAELTVVRM
jgi:hypothetical protein